jgi:hypothetical protein
MRSQQALPAHDPFGLHRLALRVTEPNLTEADLRSLLQTIGKAGAPAFANTLIELGVASYWHQTILTLGAGDDAAPGFMDTLKAIHLSETMLYMAQRAALREIDAIFGERNIAYAVIKGAHVRELVYADPALRSAGDIDILVSPAQREAAVRSLLEADYALHANPENISHEATLVRGEVAIDLHWDILRPGRTRIEIADSLLFRRQRVDDYWGLDDTDTVFLMLVHPAFAKYVCSPNMGLNRVFDFVFWLRKRSVDWDALADRLARTGLNTAAWTVLQWIDMLLPPRSLQVPDNFIARIRPGAIRACYLRFWLRHDLPTRWLQHALLIQFLFTLFLHDRPGDALHAIRGWLRSRHLRHDDPLLSMKSQG